MTWKQWNKALLVGIAVGLSPFLLVRAVYPGTVSEFPIATTTGGEVGLSVAFDGTNYLVGVRGDATLHTNITAQLVSQSGALVGPRLSVGRTGGRPQVAFDGTNYLMVWTDEVTSPNDDIYGVLVGAPFPISTAPGTQELEGIAFGGGHYVVIWRDGRNPLDYVYGQLVSKSGSLVGEELQISGAPGHFPGLAFDGANFLVVWVNDTDYYGQFISPSGALVGPHFLIESNAANSEAPSLVFFDGTRYVVNVTDRLPPGSTVLDNDHLGHYLRFVATDGTVSPTRVTLYEGRTAFGAFATAFDGQHYLVVLSEGWENPPDTPITSRGRFYDINFNPVNDWFTIAETQTVVPLGPFPIFVGGKYVGVLSMVTRPFNSFSGGDVYGIFIAASFADVPVEHWAWQFIERLYHAGITGGCSATSLTYCPEATVTRAQMAIFLLRGVHGAAYAPPAATGTTFSDVSASYWAAAWIEQLATEGITGGCGGGAYCPEATVTRAQMAVFLLRGKHGAAYAPPAATGTMFSDVSASYWAAAWIEQLATEGITGGCGGGRYCPEATVTRAQMAVFLVKTFTLP